MLLLAESRARNATDSRCDAAPNEVWPPMARSRGSEVSARLKQIRIELFGVHGGPLLAQFLGLSWRTWDRYESGAALPAEVLLRFIALTSVEPKWLLTGEGPKYRVK